MREYLRENSDSRNVRHRVAHIASSNQADNYASLDAVVDWNVPSEDVAYVERDGADSASTNFKDESPLVVECFAIAKKRQRPPPKDGYPFKKRDKVVSPLRPPPSPCKCCGSDKHWDKECPWYNLWEKKFGKSRVRVARIAGTAAEEETYDSMYNNAFEELITQACHSLYLEPAVKSARFAYAQLMEAYEAAQPQPRVREANATSKNTSAPVRKPARVTIEEVPEDFIALPTASTYLIEDAEGAGVAYPLVPGERKSSSEDARPSNREAADPYDADDDGRPTQEGVNWVKPRRYKPSGSSALGVSVLSLQGHINDINEPATDLRLDSGADITLISAEYYAKLAKPPKLRTGRKMDLWQLTDRKSKIEGYIEVPVFVKSKTGELVGLLAEAYVVPGMNVPILLGEDFHLAYELTVARHVEFGTTVSVANSGWQFEAKGVQRPTYPELTPDPSRLASFVRAKLHRRNRNRRWRKAKASQRHSQSALVSEDVRIPPHTCVNVPVLGPFEKAGTWLVEKSMLGDDRVAPLVIPNVLIESAYPRVPVANTTTKTRWLRKGEVLAELRNPDEYFDKPGDVKQWTEMSIAGHRVAALVRATREARDEESTADRVFWVKDDGSCVEVPVREAQTAESEDEKGKEVPVLEPDEEWGPKTAEVPDPTIYPSEKLEELIDVAELPEELRPRVWEMLRRRVKAFGFDGRLGHMETKCRIRTKEGVQPISVPMYASSPAKKQVIDAQINTWFAQGVIEPSQSPWGAPVVIVYRNGKARFCVDYRKLNAVTIPDEFPLPRQTEILSALSGAQVLSSLDALSGFTQIELAEEDVEKTAFRTHRGLFQFRRMPFGLKNGPSIFQRTMQNILAPYLWLFALVYIDDIVVYSRNYEEHLSHLDKVLEAIERSGLTLSPKKCHLFYSSILLLGHKVSRLGLSTHEEKVKAISELQ